MGAEGRRSSSPLSLCGGGVREAAQAAEAALGTLDRILRGPALALVATSLVILAIAAIHEYYVLEKLDDRLLAHEKAFSQALIDFAKRDAQMLAALTAVNKDADALLADLTNNRKKLNQFIIDIARRDGEFLKLVDRVTESVRYMRHRIDLLVLAEMGSLKPRDVIPGEGGQ